MSVGVGVDDGVALAVDVGVGVDDGVALAVDVGVAEGVAVGVPVWVGTGVLVRVGDAVGEVPVGDGVLVGDGVEVAATVTVGVGLGLDVSVATAVGVCQYPPGGGGCQLRARAAMMIAMTTAPIAASTVGFGLSVFDNVSLQVTGTSGPTYSMA